MTAARRVWNDVRRPLAKPETMNAMNRSIWIAAALCGGIMLPGCSETPADQAADTSDKMEKIADDAANSDARTALEWEKQRTEILTDLRNLRDDIDKELASTNVTLAKKDLKTADRTREEAMKAELEREKAVVEGSIADVEGLGAEAVPADRETVRVKAVQTRDEVKTWWAKRKEVQDQHTEADYDKDGH